MNRRTVGILGALVVVAAAAFAALRSCAPPPMPMPTEREKPTASAPAVPRPRAELPAEAATAPADSLHVTVVAAEDGSPLAGASVRLWDGRTEREVAVADAAGAAVVPLGDAEPLHVVVRMPGRLRAARDVENPRASVAIGLRFELVKSATIRGRIIADESGKPLAGVRVTALDGASGPRGGHLSLGPLIADVCSGAGGAFEVDAPTDRQVTIEASAAGRMPASTVASPTDRVELRLRPGGTLVGRVTGPDGAPAAGATVWAYPSDAQVLRRNPATAVKVGDGGTQRATSATADNEGRWRLDELPPDVDHDVFAELPDFARSALFEKVRAPRDAPIDLRLRVSTSATLRVVDEAGTAIPAWDVELWSREGAGVRTWKSPDGAAKEFARLELGRHTARVRVRGRPEVHAKFETTEGAAVQIDVVAAATGYVAGRVEDDLGAPLSEVRVVAERDKKPVVDPVDTAPDGTFRLAGLPVTRAALVDLLVVGHDGRRRVREAAIDVSTSGLRLVAPRSVTVLGKLRLPPGRATPATVTLRDRDDSYDAPWNDGRPVFERVPAGWNAMEYLVDGYLPTPKRWRDLEPGENCNDDEQTLDPGRDLRGRVIDRDGRGVAGAELSTDTADATANANGAFELNGVRSTACEISVEADGFLARKVAITADAAAQVVITLMRPVRLVGTVRGLNGADATIRIEPEDGGEVLTADVEADGVFSVEAPPGRVRIVVLCVGKESAEAVVDLVEGAEARADLSVAPVPR